MQPNWIYKSFADLTPQELYSIMQLRNQVFVVEQSCAYQDADNKDAVSGHLTGWDENKLVAYCRILPPGFAFKEASIGRVSTALSHRRTGIGKVLMTIAIQKIKDQFTTSIKIGAQLYLKKFYQSFGFIQTGDQYLEDGIPHIEMLLQ